MKSLFLLDGQGKAFTLKERVLYFLIAAFFISLFLPDMPVVGNIVIGAIVFQSLFYPPSGGKGWLLRQRKEIALMILFFGLLIVSGLISVNLKEGLDMLVLRLPLLAFPLSIGGLYIRKELKDRILLAYCAVVTLAASVCMIYSLYRYHQSGGDAAYLYDDSLSEAVRRQSIYVALMVNLALFSFVYLLFGGLIIRYRWLAYISMAFLVIFHFMLASRISIITLYSCFVLFVAFYTILKRKLVLGVGLVLGAMIVLFGLLRLFPKTINRFREINYTNYTYNSHALEHHYNMALTADQWNGANIRLAVWKCGWELAGQHWLTGVPLGDKQEKLMDVYRARHFDMGVSTRRDMHNSYLDVLCNLGVLGAAVFLLGYLVFPVAAGLREHHWLNVFIVLAFGAAMTTESWLDTSLGCILLGFFLSFVSSVRCRPLQ